MSIASVPGSTSAALAQQQAQADAASQAGAQPAGKVHQRHRHEASAQAPVTTALQAGAPSARPASRLDVMA